MIYLIGSYEPTQDNKWRLVRFDFSAVPQFGESPTTFTRRISWLVDRDMMRDPNYLIAAPRVLVEVPWEQTLEP